MAAKPAVVSTLTFPQLLAVLGIATGAIIIAGLIVLWARWALTSRGQTTTGGETEPSLVRSWLAVILVLALVMFGAVSFFLADKDLRSVLIGGLTASAATAIAFYFSSKASDQARQDILAATFGTATVPDLKTLKKDEAAKRLGETSLELVIDPGSSQENNARVSNQQPLSGSVVRKGTAVVVTLTAPGGVPGGGVSSRP